MVTRLQSTTTGSLGLIVQTSVSPTVSTVTSHVRRWRRIVLPKPRAFQVADHRQSGRFRWQGWSENDVGDVRSRTQLEVCPKSGEIDGDGDGFLPWIFELQTAAFQSFSGNEYGWVMTASLQASVRYQSRPVRWPESRELSGSRLRVGSDSRVKPHQSLSPFLSHVPLFLSFFGNQLPTFLL